MNKLARITIVRKEADMVDQISEGLHVRGEKQYRRHRQNLCPLRSQPGQSVQAKANAGLNSTYLFP